jgi:hypothetical protein
MDERDDDAVDPSKVALPAGAGAVTAANVTGAARGITGVMIDVAGFLNFLPEDFEFRAGAGGDPSTWPLVPPEQFARRAGPGAMDRLEFIWPAGAIRNKWLRVSVRAGDHNGLPADDLFYFGSLAGDTGENGGGAPVVNAIDLARVRAHLFQAAAVDSPYDLNKDGRINSLDLVIAYRARFSTLPIPPSPGASAALSLFAGRRDSDADGGAPLDVL